MSVVCTVNTFSIATHHQGEALDRVDRQQEPEAARLRAEGRPAARCRLRPRREQAEEGDQDERLRFECCLNVYYRSADHYNFERGSAASAADTD